MKVDIHRGRRGAWESRFLLPLSVSPQMPCTGALDLHGGGCPAVDALLVEGTAKTAGAGGGDAHARVSTPSHQSCQSGNPELLSRGHEPQGGRSEPGDGCLEPEEWQFEPEEFFLRWKWQATTLAFRFPLRIGKKVSSQGPGRVAGAFSCACGTEQLSSPMLLLRRKLPLCSLCKPAGWGMAWLLAGAFMGFLLLPVARAATVFN